MSAPTSLEVHHGVPRCLLRLRDRADAAALDGAGMEAALEYEHEAMRWGVDPDVSRDELAAMIDASTVELPGDEHRAEHADDFARWGRRGGLETAARYGAAWFGALARRRWGRITGEELTAAFAAAGGRS